MKVEFAFKPTDDDSECEIDVSVNCSIPAQKLTRRVKNSMRARGFGWWDDTDGVNFDENQGSLGFDNDADA